MKILNTKQVAKELGFSVPSINRFIVLEHNPLPVYKKDGKYIKVDGELVEIPEELRKESNFFIEEESLKWLLKR